MNKPDDNTAEQPWWKQKELTEFTNDEWESLCDHCAKCCLNKMEDEDDGTVYYTDIACNLLDGKTCRCSNYQERQILMPDCVRLTPQNLEGLYWMPPSCAYRLVYEGKDLPSWHHLVSGSKETIHAEGESIIGKFVFSKDIDEDEWEDRIVDWPLEWKP
ncbi:MAG: YcgN family cysteine cluster protein [Thiolinea sp.]